ncbi:DUF7134 domain-containing protein, partial [Actinoplanes philippinensis]|uniref:DUF7134 domain-containing protein n=1 Tax=Actinoplanes philippinensis TaxID=35752 RepID=UPI003478503B
MIDFAGLRDRWRRYDVAVQDLPFALLLTALALVPDWHRHGTRLAEAVPSRPFDAWGVLVIVVECLPLALRRNRPTVALALVFAGFAADQLCGYNTLGGVALAIALVSAGLHASRHRRAIVITATVAFLALAAALARIGQLGPDAVGLFYVILGAMWVVGATLRRSRRAELEHRRHLEEATRVAERTRIARELHDVVTHHV